MQASVIYLTIAKLRAGAYRALNVQSRQFKRTSVAQGRKLFQPRRAVDLRDLQMTKVGISPCANQERLRRISQLSAVDVFQSEAQVITVESMREGIDQSGVTNASIEERQ